jgi:hypothetical protein
MSIATNERPSPPARRVGQPQWRQRFTPVSPHWLRVAKLARVRVAMAVAVGWTLLDRALHAQERGSIDRYDAESTALFLEIKTGQVDAIAEAMCEMGMVERSLK